MSNTFYKGICTSCRSQISERYPATSRKDSKSLLCRECAEVEAFNHYIKLWDHGLPELKKGEVSWSNDKQS